jgi:hypothetical protein
MFAVTRRYPVRSFFSQQPASANFNQGLLNQSVLIYLLLNDAPLPAAPQMAYISSAIPFYIPSSPDTSNTNRLQFSSNLPGQPFNTRSKDSLCLGSVSLTPHHLPPSAFCSSSCAFCEFAGTETCSYPQLRSRSILPFQNTQIMPALFSDDCPFTRSRKCRR